MSADIVFEPCQPYEEPEAVPVSHILDKLTVGELRMLGAVLSAAAPASFETWLRRIWADRQVIT